MQHTFVLLHDHLIPYASGPCTEEGRLTGPCGSGSNGYVSGCRGLEVADGRVLGRCLARLRMRAPGVVNGGEARGFSDVQCCAVATLCVEMPTLIRSLSAFAQNRA